MCEQKLFELKKKMRYKQFIVYANVFVFKNFNFRTIMCQTVLRKESSHTCNIQKGIKNLHSQTDNINK